MKLATLPLKVALQWPITGGFKVGEASMKHMPVKGDWPSPFKHRWTYVPEEIGEKTLRDLKEIVEWCFQNFEGPASEAGEWDYHLREFRRHFHNPKERDWWQNPFVEQQLVIETNNSDWAILFEMKWV